MEGCLFCGIVEKKIPANIIFESSQVVAFLDIHPRAPGHAMVISRRHSENLLDLPDDAVGPLFLAVKAITRRIGEKLRPDGFTIGVNQGAASGQAVLHLHVHIIPRFTDDGGGSVHAVVDNPSETPLAEILEMLKM